MKSSSLSGAVPSDDAALAEAVRCLVEALHPERIYLFGSRARGDWGEDSDYDFMVVLPDDTEIPPSKRAHMAYGAVCDLEFAKDVLVRTSAEFKRDLPVVASLAATIAREGRLLYGEPSLLEESVSRMDAENRKAELTRDWLARAEQDLLAASRSAHPPSLWNAVAFHCQQAAEKALKAYLTWHDRPFTKTHELRRLVRQCARVAPDFGTLIGAARTLTPYAVAGRYPGSALPTAAEAGEALRLAREVVAFVVDRLPEAARP